MELKTGQHIRLITRSSPWYWAKGVVTHVYDTGTALVDLESGTRTSVYPSEVEVIDPKREALIELAETLDKARLQANAIEETAPQGGVYGRIATALQETLGAVFYASGTHFTKGYEAYDAMLESGLSVRAALYEVMK